MHTPGWSLNPSKTVFPVNVKSHLIPPLWFFSPEIIVWATACPHPFLLSSLWDRMRPLNKVKPSLGIHQGQCTWASLREEGRTNQAHFNRFQFTIPQEASLRESKWVCLQLLQMAGKSSHWMGMSWETSPLPLPFLGTQLWERERLKSFPGKGEEGICIYFRLWLLVLGLISLAKGSAS